jgi:hypothetical protein
MSHPDQQTHQNMMVELTNADLPVEVITERTGWVQNDNFIGRYLHHVHCLEQHPPSSQEEKKKCGCLWMQQNSTNSTQPLPNSNDLSPTQSGGEWYST